MAEPAADDGHVDAGRDELHGMTFIGAELFAWLRGRACSVPLEAFIGIALATAQAAVFLLFEKTPSGAVHLKEPLVGSLFTVDPRLGLRITAA